jgi:predicted short-subunit dehydrogenase-like oxidoreductase (DUF2520 family)
MDVSVVGAGRVGTAFAVRLCHAGHRILAVSGGSRTSERASRYLPGVQVVAPADAVRDAEVVLIATPDDLIEETCVSLTGASRLGNGVAVAHLSGATSLDALSAARSAGATVLSIHPLQTFPDVDLALVRLPGSAIAVTAVSEPGFLLGERLATDVGGRPFRLPDEAKPLYHAAAVFASNYLVSVVGLAEELFQEAGLSEPAKAFLPLSRASLDNVETAGTSAALTGPLIRGDAGTVARNLDALSRHMPSAIPAYVALAYAALGLGDRSGRLAPERRSAVEEVLDRWR